MTDLLKHAYDLHIHCGPDIIPRSVTALEMAERAVKRGMKGFAIKSHYAPTCLQAATVRACYPGRSGDHYLKCVRWRTQSFGSGDSCQNGGQNCMVSYF